MISPLTPKSSSTPSSRRAFCSSASFDRLESRTTFFGSDRKCSDGISKLSGADQRGLRLALHAGAGCRTRRRGGDAGAGVGAEVLHLRRLAPARRRASPSRCRRRQRLVRRSARSSIAAQNSGSTRARPSAPTGRFGALGRIDPLGATPPAGAKPSVVVEMRRPVVADSARSSGARSDLQRQPPMGDRAERQHALVVVVFIVEGVVVGRRAAALGAGVAAKPLLRMIRPEP